MLRRSVFRRSVVLKVTTWVVRLCLAAIVALLLKGLLLAQATDQKTLASPEDAVKALYAADLGDE